MVCDSKPTRVPQLPTDVVSQLLQRVDQKQRLTSCALVSSSWQQASKSATTSVQCKLVDPEGYASLSAWVSSNITSIDVGPSLHMRLYSTLTPFERNAPVLQLPVDGLGTLQHLHLQLCRLQTASAHAATGAAAGTALDSATAPQLVPASLGSLTALTGLKLVQCLFDVRGLNSCVHLQQLQLADIGHADAAIAAPTVAPVADATKAAAALLNSELAAALPQLQQLTQLTMRRGYTLKQQLSFGTVSSGLSNLQHLLELTLDSCDITAVGLAHLPTSLTRLKLHGAAELTVDTVPRLQLLSNLQHLDIDMATQFGPLLLRNYPRLQYLKLVSCNIEPETAVAELMSALLELKQLQYLDLFDSLKSQLEEAAPYAALTASTQLTHLRIYESFFATDAAEVIFAADRPCNGLREVEAGAELFSEPGSFERFVACCPALQELEINASTGESDEINLEGLTALKALTNLTKLMFGDVSLSAEALCSIATCTQLRDLSFNTEVIGQQVITRQELPVLTQLRGLTRLVLDDRGKVEFLNQAADGESPNVFGQLAFHCWEPKEEEV